jgi:diguanylate cyclase (GGDEF)-like protein
MSGVNAVNMSLLVWGSVFCALLAFAIGLTRSFDRKKKICVIINQLVASGIMGADAMSCILRGKTGEVNYYLIRLSGFLTYLLSDLLLISFMMYVAINFFGTFLATKDVIIKRVIGVYVIAVIGCLLVIYSAFAKTYYYYDENNLYHRGPWFVLSVIIPEIGILMIFSIVVQYRKTIPKYILTSMYLFVILPTVGVVMCIFVRGFSFGNIAIGITMVVLFIVVTVEQNMLYVKSAITDARTGLLNSHGFTEELNRLIRNGEATKYNVYVFNIRRFSLVNNRYGSKNADDVLVAYSRKLKKFTQNNEIVARQGSDNFIALIEKERADAFIDFTEGVVVKVEGMKHIAAEISAYVGGFEITSGWKDAGAMVTNASMALAIAKTEQKRVVYLTKEHRDKILEMRQLEEMLPSALEHHEFQPYYQPKVDINTGELCGAEALVRWFHEDNMLPPASFVPVFEKNEAICRIDLYMLREVCSDLSRWIEDGLNPPTISVNFSRRHLNNPNLAEDIESIISEYELPKGMIEVEVTETIDEFDMNDLKHLVDGLRNRGVMVAIDDFGTGSSSLNLLRDMDFDFLKVDKSFVERSYDKDLKLLRHIINIAKELNVSVIAEGVEHQEQIKTLRMLGCDRVQGYVYDRPLPRDEFEKRMKSPVYTTDEA